MSDPSPITKSPINLPPNLGIHHAKPKNEICYKTLSMIMMISAIMFEDDRQFRRSFQEYFEDSDKVFLAAAFADAENAVAQVKRHKPDVVIMDIQMPGINGLEALRLIKAASPSNNLPKNRLPHRLRSGINVQFSINLFDMIPHSIVANFQLRGNHFTIQAIDHCL